MSMDDLSGMQIGRREAPRLQLGIAARWRTSGADYRVRLDDLSVAGARIVCIEPIEISAGRLSWLGFNCPAQVAWQDGSWSGLSFDDELSEEALQKTRKFARLIRTDTTGKYLKLASAWAHGKEDWPGQTDGSWSGSPDATAITMAFLDRRSSGRSALRTARRQRQRAAGPLS